MNFELPHIPKRTSLPRESGLTMMMDKGLSWRQAENFVDSCSEYTDLVKLGFGTSYLTKDLKQKIKIYHEAGFKVYLGGTLFEAFIIRGMFDDYRRLLDKFDIKTTEVSDGSIALNHDLKCEYITKLSKDFTVLSEVGSKEEGILISPNKWINMMSSELEAGAWKVIAEARESGNVGIYRPNGTAHVALVNKIISKVAPENILWEAPIKSQQVWFIKQFGTNVNLGNIGHDEVIPLETLRIGLRGDTFHDFLPEEIAKKTVMINFIVLDAPNFKTQYERDTQSCLIDVREDYEYEDDNIGGINIPMGDVLSHVNDLKNNTSIYVCCQTGKRSRAIGYHLAKNLENCTIYSCDGGILAYKELL